MVTVLETITEADATRIAKARMLADKREVTFMQTKYCDRDSLEYKYHGKCCWQVSFMADDRPGVLPTDISLWIDAVTGEIIPPGFFFRL